MPESSINQFGQWIVTEDWDCMDLAKTSSTQAKVLQDVLQLKLDEIFHNKVCKIVKQG